MSRLIGLSITLFLLLGLAQPASAGTTTFNINVRATIPTYTALVLERGANANSLNISDVSNQSVIVDNVGSMNIQSNATNGFSLSVISLNGFYLVRPGESPPTISPGNTNFFKYAIRLIMFSTVYIFGPSPYSGSRSFAASSGLPGGFAQHR